MWISKKDYLNLITRLDDLESNMIERTSWNIYNYPRNIVSIPLKECINKILHHLKLNIVHETKAETTKLVSSTDCSDVTYSGLWLYGTASPTHETQKTKKPTKKKK